MSNVSTSSTSKMKTDFSIPYKMFAVTLSYGLSDAMKMKILQVLEIRVQVRFSV
jgi:hypothetical protein